MTNRANTADKPRRNSGNQFSLATTETWKIIALRKKETEGVVRGGDSSYQPRLACKRTSSRNWSSLVVGGGKVWEPCVILIGLMPTSYNTTQPFPLFSILLHASVFFSHPCWLRPLGATTVTSLARREFKRENGIIWKIFYAKLSSELFVKTISCRVQKLRLAHSCTGRVSISVSWVYSPFFWSLQFFLLARKKGVSSSFLFMCEQLRNWEYYFARSISCIAWERTYKEFLKRLWWKSKIRDFSSHLNIS